MKQAEKIIAEDQMQEALCLLKAIAPKRAPYDALGIKTPAGLSIMVNPMLPENTVVVSQRLFDMIYEHAEAEVEGRE